MRDFSLAAIASTEATPRFLFRIFGFASGGGHPRLNTEKGITPHAFLRGERPTSIYHMSSAKLKQIIDGHLSGVTTVKTCFSSWAASLHIALDAAHACETVAVLDTRLLPSHVRIYYVSALWRAGLSSGHYSQEYLAYGPISGPAYHCVPLTAVRKAGLPSPQYWLYSDYYLPPPENPIYDSDVAQAKQVAAMFQRPRREQPEVVVTVTALVLALKYRGWREVEDISPDDLDLITSHLAHELALVRIPARSSEPVGLVNPAMDTKDFPHLRQMVVLLRAIEKHLTSRPRLAARKALRRTRM